MTMKEKLTKKNGSILTPFLAGGVLGAGAALVLAPQSGKETRKDLKRIADRFSQAADIGRDLYGEGSVFVSKAVEAGRKAFMEEKPLEPIIVEQRSRLAPILTSGIIGAGIGAGIALLLAPKSGSETREDLKRLASSTRETVVSAIDKSRHLYVTGKSAITDALGSDEIPYVEGKKEVIHAV
jgi:gas vesicle protein